MSCGLTRRLPARKTGPSASKAPQPPFVASSISRRFSFATDGSSHAASGSLSNGCRFSAVFDLHRLAASGVLAAPSIGGAHRRNEAAADVSSHDVRRAHDAHLPPLRTPPTFDHSALQTVTALPQQHRI